MLRATSRAGTAIIDRIDHDLDFKVPPGFYLMRDLLRIIDEKAPEEPFGIAFGDEEFIQLFDRSNLNHTEMYQFYFKYKYPQSVFYFWDGGTKLEKMDCTQFFLKVRAL